MVKTNVFLMVNQFLSMVQEHLQDILLLILPPDCTVLETWVFRNFILNDKLFDKAL